MQNKILIINSKENINPLLPFFEKLSEKNYSYYLLSFNNNLIKSFFEKGWTGKLINKKDLPENFLKSLALALFSPFINLISVFKLFIIKRREKITHLICTDSREQLIYTCAAKFLKIKIIWFILPGPDSIPKNKLLKKIWLRRLKKARVIMTRF